MKALKKLPLLFCRCLVCIGILVLGFNLARAYGEDQHAKLEYPKYGLLRFEEDWTPMDCLCHRNFLDCLKHMHLDHDGLAYLSLGGQWRERVEVWDNYNFGAPTRDNDIFLVHRLQVHGDLHLSEHFRVFGEFLNALSSHRMLSGGIRTSDVDTVAIMNGFLEAKYPYGGVDYSLRVGRQQFAFGNQRLISPLPWANTYRRWDGISLIARHESWWAHAWGSFYTPVRKYDFDDPDNDEIFYGVYGNYKKMFDLYAFARDADRSTRTAFRDERYTVGFRIYDSVFDENFDYELEAAYQVGAAARIGAPIGSNVSVSSGMLAAKVNYVFKQHSYKPGAWLGFDIAEGDRDTGGAFMPDYPLGHAYFGFIDIIGRRNIIDFSQAIYVSPLKGLKIELANHIFWRQTTSDGIYTAGNTLLRASGGNSERYVGDEVDLTVQYELSHNIKCLLGYSRFFAGDFIDQTGANKDINFGYAQLQVLF